MIPNTPQAAVAASHAEFVPAEPDLAVIFVRCPPVVKKRLQDLAHYEKKSVNALVVELLSATLAGLYDEPPAE